MEGDTLDEEKEEMVVTPWKVMGKIDYEKLIEKFGTKPLTDELLKRIEKHAGTLHLQLRRGLFFSHRDLDWVLDMYDKGEKFVLYTGRGPSGPVHIGHLVPWIFTKYLQDSFNAKLYFQMTDDEKYLINPRLTTKRVLHYTYENILDIIAVGFDPKKTLIISDMRCARTMYNVAVDVARHVTLSTAKAVFGFEDSSNIGIIFFTAVQAVPAFLESIIAKKNVPCLIPAAIDQDPYWRVTRDIAPKLGFYKPAQIHCKFLPGLGKGGKMSASMPETCIFTVDKIEVVEKKIMNAFTGGRATVEEQRRLGGDPTACPVHQYLYYIFEEDDDKIRELYRSCVAGEMLCYECKRILLEKVKPFLEEHQRKREKAKDLVGEFLADDRIEIDLPWKR